MEWKESKMRRLIKSVAEPKYEAENLQQGSLHFQLQRLCRNSKETGVCYHWHERLEFYYVVSGKVDLLYYGKVYTINAGDIAFINWCIPHQGLSFQDGTVMYNLKTDFSLLGQYKTIFQTEHFEKWHFTNCQKLRELFEQLIHYASLNSSYEYLRINGFISEIYIYLLNSNAPFFNLYKKEDTMRGKVVKNVIEFININYQLPLTTGGLAEFFHLSESYLCRLFKQETGSTLIEYVNVVRCLNAVKLIQDGKSLTEISQTVGFHDYNYFSRCFKKVYYISPSEYRKNLGGETNEFS